MNEREQAVFAEISESTELTLDEALLLDCAVQDRELCDVLEEYQEYKEDMVRRLFSQSSGDYGDYDFFESRIELAFVAVRLKYALTERQIVRLARMCGSDLDRFLGFRRR